ncbi:MAG: VOC family protein [Oscillospiraceae bacterium]|jgi:catechol 2,3-dioxygenase-like lactoylglutathione lyase family enzyme|nr:VOC family protein [Oscillospiraceae bacterium]
MKFAGPLVVVTDIRKARTFYESVLGQTVKYDFGENIQFESGISLQTKSSFAAMVGVGEDAVTLCSHNGELYFETKDFDATAARLNGIPGIRYRQKLMEHPWGQRVSRLYDPDGNLIEIGETMQTVARRYLKMGWTVEKAAEKTQLPLEQVAALWDV